jgi:hypothetical protein
MNAINDHCIHICNSLLRSELSAVETYTQVIDKYDGKPASQLERIRNSHLAAAERIRENIFDMGGVPKEETGVWGFFGKGLQGIANLFGPDSAIDGLQRGEENARSEYEMALEDKEVMAASKDMIRHELLRRIHRNIAALEMLSHEG